MRRPNHSRYVKTMDWIELLLIGFIGLSVGSFLNVSIDRIPSGKSLVHPPSSCDVCKTRLKTFDLIPVGSYLALKGKCRYCSASIPFRSPLVEFITGTMFVAIWAKFGITYEGIAIMAYASLYLVIFAIDLEHKIIPNVIVFPALLLTLLASAFLPGLGIANAAIGAGVGFGMLLALYMVPGAVIGEGDVKLAAVVGAAVGFPLVTLGIGLAFVLGGTSATLLLVTGRRKRKDGVAFGPYIALAALITLVWGDPILEWYLETFLRI